MPFIIEEDSQLRWLPESQAKPADRTIWLRARMLAQADKDYNAVTAKILTNRLYRMLGGTFIPKKKPKKKASRR